MNESSHAPVVAAADGVYPRWRGAPKYRLNNLAGDVLGWRFIDLDELEVLAFDQCVVFGATFPGDAGELVAAARRDAVVRQARGIAWAAYRAYVQRADAARRRRFARGLATAVDDGAGSSGSLLPVVLCDADAAVGAEANTVLARLAAAVRA